MDKRKLMLRDMRISHGYNLGGKYAELNVSAIIPHDYPVHELYEGMVSVNAANLAPEKVFTKCRHCGQWAAIRTDCKKCGAPVDPEEE